ncbi:MAG: AzlD domain-containing protein [Alphaproteobacteria bacterium]|nr:AzlD domain-containing protein [Alphaproteobacteria bacterium]
MGEAPPWALLAVAVAGTYLWRGLGVALAGRVDEGSPVFEWVGCVAYALAAAVSVRIILWPTGLLATTPVGDRVSATVIGLAACWALRRSVPLALAAGAGAFAVLTALRGG